MNQESMTKADHIYASNEWWRRYRDEPEKFGREFQAIAEVNAAQSEGRDPTLGERDWADCCFLLAERDKAKVAT